MNDLRDETSVTGKMVAEEKGTTLTGKATTRREVGQTPDESASAINTLLPTTLTIAEASIVTPYQARSPK